MQANKWRTPMMLAACIHVVIFMLLVSVLSEPAISKEQEYIEVTLAELFTPPEPINTQERSAQQNEDSQTATETAMAKQTNAAALTEPLVGHPSESLAQLSSPAGIAGNSSMQSDAVPVTASKSAPGISRGPRVIKSQEPVFSEEARKQGWQGTVRIRIVISEYGSVQEVQLAGGSGYRQLDEAALACIRGWQFSPALKDGRAVPARIVIPITFKLN